MQIAKAGLFGGTLLAAGLSSAANAQQFDFAYELFGGYTSFVQAYAYDGVSYGDLGPSAYSFGPASALVSATKNYSGFTSAASVGATVLSASADNRNAVLAGDPILGFQPASFGVAYAYVVQSVDTDILIEWDFSNEDPNGFSPTNPFFGDINIVNFTDGVTEFQIDFQLDPLAPSSGSLTITLEAGKAYGLTVDAGAAQGGFASASITAIPTPGAIGLLAAAGLASTRRRRG